MDWIWLPMLIKSEALCHAIRYLQHSVLKTRRANTFLGEVYWLSKTEQTPTKKDAPMFECFLAGKGKHCFRNADGVYLWILNDSNPAPFVGVGHQSCSLRRNIPIQTFAGLAPWTASQSSSHTWLGIKNPWKNTKKIFKSSSSHKIANVEKHLSR